MGARATSDWKKRRYTEAARLLPSKHQGPVLVPCHYCGEQLKIKQATVDHVVPKSSGGRDFVTNFVLSCYPCNARKGTLATIPPLVLEEVKPKVPKRVWEPPVEPAVPVVLTSTMADMLMRKSNRHGP